MGILIVDRQADRRAQLEEMLLVGGLPHSWTAPSVQDALELLAGGAKERAASPIKLVLADLDSIGWDGGRFCRQIQTTVKDPYLPVIILAEKRERDLAEAAFHAGAADYVTKPVEEDVLRLRVQAALKTKEALDRHREREWELLRLTERLESAIQNLQTMATTDGLTGLYNRRHFDSYLSLVWDRALRDRTPLTLIMIDVDHFKAYNDYYGHPQGDGCLRRVAQALKGCLTRSGDALCRYGGEEFAVILPNTHAEGGRWMAENLRQAVEELAMPHGLSGVMPYVTISCGVATFVPAIGQRAEDLIEAADKALYAAKEQGRNRTVPAIEEGRCS